MFKKIYYMFKKVYNIYNKKYNKNSNIVHIKYQKIFYKCIFFYII